MSPVRLAIPVIMLLAYSSATYAQKDSLLQTILPSPGVSITQADQKLSNSADTIDSVLNEVKEIPGKYVSKVTDKITGIDTKLSKQTLKALKKFQKQAARISRKYLSKDSLNLKGEVENNLKKLDVLKDEFLNIPDTIADKIIGQYDSYIDTLKSTFKYLQNKTSKVTGKVKFAKDKLTVATSKINILEGKLQKAEEIKQYMREYREILKQQLDNVGMVKQLKQLDKSIYYYSEYIKEYKSILKDRKKIEKAAMAVLYKIPAFKKFMAQNSWVNSLFPQSDLSGNLTQTQLLAGLQSRVNIQQHLGANLSAGGPNINQILSQQMQVANGELNKLKDKINKYGGDGEAPNFRPNSQKTKSFKERLEYGTNIQFAKSDKYFPTTSEIAISLGYKFSDTKIVGIGMGYKIGFGKEIRHIKFTLEGISFKSYLDVKLKKQFFISGGYEQNYLTAIKNISALRNYSAWTSSGLIGISKKYKASKKLNGKMQFLIDLLYNNHVPNTQQFIFRTGLTL